MEKDFDQWNERKKDIEINVRQQEAYFSEREAWWASFGLNIGVEIDGKHESFQRPCVILRKFNRHMLLVVPTSSRNDIKNKYYIKLSENSGRIYTVCLSQIRVISSKRLSRKIGTIQERDYQVVIDKICEMILGRL